MSRRPSRGCRDFPIFQCPPSSNSGEERLPVNKRLPAGHLPCCRATTSRRTGTDTFAFFGWRQGRYFQMTGRLTNVDIVLLQLLCRCFPFPTFSASTFWPASVGGLSSAQPHQVHQLHHRRAEGLREESYLCDNGCVQAKRKRPTTANTCASCCAPTCNLGPSNHASISSVSHCRAADQKSKGYFNAVRAVRAPADGICGRMTFISYPPLFICRFRLLCQSIIAHKLFDYVVLVFIFLNCITVALERPKILQGSVVRINIPDSFKHSAATHATAGPDLQDQQELFRSDGDGVMLRHSCASVMDEGVI